MNRSVRRRIWESVAATAFARFVNIGYHFVLVPILLATWGLEVYGEWILLTAFATLASLSSLGFVNAAGAEIIIRIVAGDREEAIRILTTSLIALASLVIAVILIVAGLLTLFEPASLLAINIIPVRDTIVIVMLSVASVVLSFFAAPLSSVLGAVVGAGLPAVTNALVKAAEVVAIGCVALFGGGPMAAATMLVASVVLNIVLLIVLNRYIVPWISFDLKSFDHSVFKRLLRLSFDQFLLYASVNLVAIQLPRIALGHLAGPAVVAIFSVSVTYARAARILTSLVSQSLQVESTRAFAEGRREFLERLTQSVCQVNLWVAIGLTVTLVAVADPLFAAWTRGQIAADRLLLIALGLGAVIGAYGDAVASFLAGINRVWELAVAHSMATLAAIVTGALATPFFGATGMAAALIAPEVVLAVVGAWVTSRILSVPTRGFVANTLKWPVHIVLQEVQRIRQLTWPGPRPN